ncbi:hypothetical protein PhCBS80983_g04744 [Powellomyces hirtus]|uniref:Pyrroloquinoline quinone-dependent pyranose dehydrogenase beta-propeller domain-containing protein n=1 Tax=Powellomyces hirtus TaxID=109895 RepID=A0A507DWP3_9FUNG|nr:hypothetical protein PhCBS80983_g04744 [Powellomyces hirtus]
MAKPTRCCGTEWTKKALIITAIVATLVAVGVTVGLAVGLTRRNNDSPTGRFASSPYTALSSQKGTPDLVATGLPGIRSLLFDDSTGVLLAVVKGTQQIVSIAVKPPSAADNSKVVLIDASQAKLKLNHGIAMDDAYLYASSATTVYRWKYDRKSPTIDVATREIFINNIDGADPNSDTAAGHITRTIVLDRNWMYVSVGSAGNVDRDSSRSKVRRFAYKSATTLPIDYQKGEVWADGVRNAVSMAFDARGAVWIAVNGADDLARPDLAPDMVQDSPVEPIYKLNGPANAFYGYPYCFVAGNTTGTFATDTNAGKVYAWPDFMNDGTHTDAWCQNPANVILPDAMVPAHAAPLAAQFHTETGDMYLALHGSWNRNIPSGYSLVRLPFTPAGTPTTNRVTDTIMWLTAGPCAYGGSCFRPAGLAIVGDVAYVSSDNTGDIVRVKL